MIIWDTTHLKEIENKFAHWQMNSWRGHAEIIWRQPKLMIHDEQFATYDDVQLKIIICSTVNWPWFSFISIRFSVCYASLFCQNNKSRINRIEPNNRKRLVNYKLNYQISGARPFCRFLGHHYRSIRILVGFPLLSVSDRHDADRYSFNGQKRTNCEKKRAASASIR